MKVLQRFFIDQSMYLAGCGLLTGQRPVYWDARLLWDAKLEFIVMIGSSHVGENKVFFGHGIVFLRLCKPNSVPLRVQISVVEIVIGGSNDRKTY
jgi:hypothetical protein